MANSNFRDHLSIFTLGPLALKWASAQFRPWPQASESSAGRRRDRRAVAAGRAAAFTVSVGAAGSDCML